MASRRRPQRHFRRTASGVVEINRDVAPRGPAGRSGAARTLVDATQHLPADPPPVDEATASVLAPEPYLISQHQFYDLPPDWHISHENRVDPATGEGKIVTAFSHTYKDELRHEEILKVGPGMRSLRWNINLDLRRANIPGAHFGERLIRCTFTEANLDGARFGEDFRNLLIEDTSFEGASLRDARFQFVDLHRVSFVGVDGTGARFQLALVPSGVDITDSNLHPDQFVFDSDPKANSASCLTYRRYRLADAAEALGVDADGFAIDVWAGNVEVRDNDTCEVVDSGYDDARHHIPQWAVQTFYESDGAAPA